MSSQAQASVSTLIDALRDGTSEARSQLMERVYDELRRMAALVLQGERPEFSLQPSDVVQETYLRLFRQDFQPENRGHFFGAASRAMREVVAEHARQRKTQKRGEGCKRVPLDDVVEYFEQRNLVVESVREALDRLAAIRPRPSQVMTLRYFFRYTAQETATLLQVSQKTVKNDERFARAWLHGQLAAEAQE